MATKTCKHCGIEKDKKEFYKTSGLTCKECKKAQTGTSLTTSLLREILQEQKNIREILETQIIDMEAEILSLQKSMKKLMKKV